MSVDYEALLPQIAQGGEIPKCIYQTCRDKQELHQEIEHNIDYLQTINPGWEYRLYDDGEIEDFIRYEYGDSECGWLAPQGMDLLV